MAASALPNTSSINVTNLSSDTTYAITVIATQAQEYNQVLHGYASELVFARTTIGISGKKKYKVLARLSYHSSCTDVGASKNSSEPVDDEHAGLNLGIIVAVIVVADTLLVVAVISIIVFLKKYLSKK